MKYLKLILLSVVLLMPSWAWPAGTLTPAAHPQEAITLISQSAIPLIKASTGSMANNGAISAMTALPRIYSSGAYIYLPAGAIAAGVPAAATWYWFVGSSTTAGTVYNCTYTSGTPTPCTATAFVTTGPGAYTGVTGSLTSLTLTMPGNSMGANGRVEANFEWQYNNTAGTKVFQPNFGGSTWHSRSDTTSLYNISKLSAQNRGVTNVQALGVSFLNSSAGASIVQAVDGAADTTANVTISVTMNNNTATDHQILESYRILVMRQN